MRCRGPPRLSRKLLGLSTASGRQLRSLTALGKQLTSAGVACAGVFGSEWAQQWHGALKVSELPLTLAPHQPNLLCMGQRLGVFA